MAETGGRATRSYWAMMVTLWAALVAALAGWLGGLGPPYREFAWDTSEMLGIWASFLLLPVALTMTVSARSRGVPYKWRVMGWFLCLITLLLPALLLANTFLDAPGYSAFGCGSLLNPTDLDSDATAQAVCEPVRTARAGVAWTAAAIGASAAAVVGLSALLPPARRAAAPTGSRH